MTPKTSVLQLYKFKDFEGNFQNSRTFQGSSKIAILKFKDYSRISRTCPKFKDFFNDVVTLFFPMEYFLFVTVITV